MWKFHDTSKKKEKKNNNISHTSIGKQARWRRSKIANNLITNQQCIIMWMHACLYQFAYPPTHTLHRWTISIINVAYGIDILKPSIRAERKKSDLCGLHPYQLALCTFTHCSRACVGRKGRNIHIIAKPSHCIHIFVIQF